VGKDRPLRTIGYAFRLHVVLVCYSERHQHARQYESLPPTLSRLGCLRVRDSSRVCTDVVICKPVSRNYVQWPLVRWVFFMVPSCSELAQLLLFLPLETIGPRLTRHASLCLCLPESVAPLGGSSFRTVLLRCSERELPSISFANECEGRKCLWMSRTSSSSRTCRR
jgi:hypothetical protein